MKDRPASAHPSTAGDTSAGKGALYKKYSKSVRLDADPNRKMRPSEFNTSAAHFNAAEYPKIVELNNMADNTQNVNSNVDMDQPLFQPSPKVVIFDNYAPYSIQEQKLFFRNNDTVARRIKVYQPTDTPFFEVSAPRSVTGELLKQSKIAAGMEICFIVKFKPEEVRDYSLDLLCSTEREKFIVPVRAQGPRPYLVLPDDVNFGPCPVKLPTKKMLLIQNMGTTEVQFALSSSHEAFGFGARAEPISLQSKASINIETFFTPNVAEFIESELILEFTNNSHGKIYIGVSGMGKNVDVALSTPSLVLEPSFISLLSQNTLRIRNMGTNPINFCWKSYANSYDEVNERVRLLSELNRMEAMETRDWRERLDSGYYDSKQRQQLDGGDDQLLFSPMSLGVLEEEPQIELDNNNDENYQINEIDADDGVPYRARADEAVLLRKYRNLRLALENDPMQFVDDIFEISPLEGTLYANSEMEVAVVFRPDTAAQYTCLAYLDVAGREDRLPLRLSGQGIGPNASLSMDVLGDCDYPDCHPFPQHLLQTPSHCSPRRY